MVNLIGAMPGNGASNVSSPTDLYLLFSAPVGSGPGNIELHRVDNTPSGTTSREFGSFSTINTSTNATYGLVEVTLQLVSGTKYYVTIDGMAIYQDPDPYNADPHYPSNPEFYNGFTGSGDFTFTTAPQPILTDLTSPKAYTVGSAPTLLAPGASFSETTFTSGKVTVSGLLSEDIVSLPDGTFNGYSFSNGSISLNESSIGSYSGGNGNTFTVILNQGTTATDAQKIVRLLSYSDGSGSPTASRNLNIAVSDQTGRTTYDASHLAFEAPVSTNPPNGAIGGSTAIGDLNGDGTPDLLDSSSGSLQLYLGSKSGGSITLTRTPDSSLSSLNIESNYAIALGDLNGDGTLDLIVGKTDGSIVTFLNTGTSNKIPTFSSTPIQLLAPSMGSTTPTITVADLNNDGLLDIVYKENNSYYELQNISGQNVEVDVTPQAASTPPSTGANPPSTGANPPSTGPTPPSSGTIVPPSTNNTPTPLLPPPVVAFDPTVTTLGSTVTLTGTATAAAGASVTGVDILEDGAKIGSATVTGGAWVYDFSQPAGFHTDITAVATDSQDLQASAPSYFDLTTGITGEPYAVQQDSYDTAYDYEGSTFFKASGKVYETTQYTANPDGSSVYVYLGGTAFDKTPYFAYGDHYAADGTTLTSEDVYYKDGHQTVQGLLPGQALNSIYNDTFLPTGGSNTFVFTKGFGDDTITSFILAGTDRDTVSLQEIAPPAGNSETQAQADAKRLANILAHATGDGQGDTTIKIGQGDTITFTGVSVAQLQKHAGDFVFHA